MKSNLPKGLHTLCGRPMLSCVVKTVRSLGVRRIIVVVGHQASRVKKALESNIEVVKQRRLLGTADAVMQTRKLLNTFKGDVLILYADSVLLEKQTIRKLILHHRKTRAHCSLLTAQLKNPSGYGHILRDRSQKIRGIIEERNASQKQRKIKEVNAGVYCFKKDTLFKALKRIKPDNIKKEYYLTDIVAILNEEGRQIETVSTQDSDEIFGINSREDLSRADDIMRRKILAKIILRRVTIIDPHKNRDVPAKATVVGVPAKILKKSKK